MRLKRVRVFGFKTFADRAEFSLEGGVVAVVGSNGCGKSNLVDAILWGLGEGNVRHLRAQSGQDVIFSGSSKRKPLGFAEVSLLFDNEDGALPIATSEVSIGRRTTRAGDSEYSINRQACRLRDVYDLLSDSGLGRAGYSIVGQKEIDSALSASAEERRGWVDEAAGVQRYRVRKIESQRRLGQAQEHLARVLDILTELEAQREPLRAEAEVALRYRSANDALREVEVGLLVSEVAKAVRDVAESQRRLEESTRLNRDESAKAEQLERSSNALNAEISLLDLELDRLRAAEQAATLSLQNAESNQRLLEQRLQALLDQEKSLTEDADSARTRIEEAHKDLAALEIDLLSEQEKFDQIAADSSGSEEEARRLTILVAEIEAQLKEARESESRRLKLAAEAAHRADRLIQSKRELAGIVSGLPELESGIDEARSGLAVCDASLQRETDEIAAIEASLADLRLQEDSQDQSVRSLLAERAAVQGRIRGIEATIDTYEGLNQGARAVLEAAQRGVLSASFVPVGHSIEVDKDIALAIETALGGSAHDLIVVDPEVARDAISWLKQNRAGRATFQPITLMRPSSPDADMRTVLREQGIIGRASELVRCDPDHRPVIDSLLGRIVVVRSLEDALKLARTTGWSRMVTLEGEVLHSGGAVTGGHQARQSYGLVQRKADLLDLEKQNSRLDAEVRSIENRSVAQQKERTELIDRISEVKKRMTPLRTERDEAEQFLRALTDELKSGERERSRLKQEILSLESVTEAPQTTTDLATIELRRDAAIRSLSAKSADSEQAEARLRDSKHRIAQARSRYESAQRRLQTATESEVSRQRRVEGLEPERSRVRVQIDTSAVERAEAESSRSRSSEELAAAQSKRRALLDQSLELNEQARAARQNAAAIGDASHQAEISRTRADARRASSLERLYQEYGLSEQDAIDQESLREIPKDAPALVNRLRRELKAMGVVNLGAIEAFERLDGRLDELGAQRTDVLDGIRQVEASIRELDHLTRDKFMGTFEAVAEAFGSIFQRLFAGGEGALILSDKDNVLESGVDISVTLPGKKHQQLSLLSGGERALCAIAFLFALLKVKPSPLVVLDEVDAPLDGANVERYAALLHEFTESTQFIVITHNQTTIASAPVWLGVTMQEPGVSMLLPFRVPIAAD